MNYEEPYRQKAKKNRRRRRSRRSFSRWLIEGLLRLLALALILAILIAGVLYALPVSFFAVEREGADLSLTGGLPQDRANMLLLGLDALHENARRSDAILIATIGYGEVKLTSVLRDTVLPIPGHGEGKLNAAYAYGGAELVMKTLNENFKLDLMHYVAVDYATLIGAVDALGGVEVDLSEAEVEKINRDVAATRARRSTLSYSDAQLTHSGQNIHLNGLQALTYARIRKLDSDFMRTGRQRALLRALLTRLKQSLWNPVRLVRLARVLLTSADSNMSLAHLISLGEKALAADEIEQLRLPVDGTYEDDGASLKVTDLQSNVGRLQMFLYD